MSRGFGSIQQDIISFLKNASFPLSQNEVIWALAEQKKILKKSSVSQYYFGGELNNSFYKSCCRAFAGLIKSNKVEIKTQKDLSVKYYSIDEFIRHYPYKTRNNLLKELRIDILPYVKTYISEHIHELKYNKHQIEQHSIEVFAQNDTKGFKECTVKWDILRAKLLKIIGIESNAEISKAILSLVVKGEQLFGNSQMFINGATSVLAKKFLDSVEDTKIPYNNIKDEINYFLSNCIYSNLYSHGVFKNQLYIVASFEKNINPTLNKDFKGALFRIFPEKIISLPGTKIATPPKRIKKGAFVYFTLKEENKFDPILDKLILRDVFSPIRYIVKLNP